LRGQSGEQMLTTFEGPRPRELELGLKHGLGTRRPHAAENSILEWGAAYRQCRGNGKLWETLKGGRGSLPGRKKLKPVL